MKAIIYCFSGTGNTLFAARETVKALTRLGIETDIYRIVSEDSPLYAVAWLRCISFGKFEVCPATRKEGACLTDSAYGYFPDPNNYDIAGFAYPIHSYNAPGFFLNFLKALPKLKDEKKGMKAFLFKTSGKRVEMNDASSWAPSRVLKNKGFFPCIDMNIPMPNIMFRYQDAMVKQMALNTKEMSARLAQMVNEGNFPLCDFNPFTVLYSIPFRFQSLAARINGFLYTVDQKRCTSCGKCVSTCSSGNIYIVGKTSIKDPKKVFRLPQIGGDCSMCMQCTVTCPHGAITPGLLKNRKLNSGWNFSALLADDSIIPSDQMEPEAPEAPKANSDPEQMTDSEPKPEIEGLDPEVFNSLFSDSDDSATDGSDSAGFNTNDSELELSVPADSDSDDSEYDAPDSKDSDSNDSIIPSEQMEPDAPEQKTESEIEGFDPELFNSLFSDSDDDSSSDVSTPADSNSGNTSPEPSDLADLA